MDRGHSDGWILFRLRKILEYTGEIRDNDQWRDHIRKMSVMFLIDDHLLSPSKKDRKH